MGPHVSLQIKGVIEPFATEGAQMSLYLAVTLHVTVEHPLQAKAFATQLTIVQRRIVAGASRELTDGNKTWFDLILGQQARAKNRGILPLHSEKNLTVTTQEKLNSIANGKSAFIVRGLSFLLAVSCVTLTPCTLIPHTDLPALPGLSSPKPLGPEVHRIR